MAKLVLHKQQIEIIGQIDFVNAAQVYQQGLDLIAQVQHWPVQINLAQLQHGNTLALAVLIQWLRACPDMLSLRLTHVPAKMQGIIQASHLQQLLS